VSDQHGVPEEPMLTVAQAAELMSVVYNTVHNWIREGRIEFDVRNGIKVVVLSKLRAAKLLRESDASNHLTRQGVDSDGLIARAVARGAARPIDSRYSLEDVEAILAFHNGVWKRPESATPPEKAEEAPRVADDANENAVPVEPDDFLVRAARWDALKDYIKNHGDPARLPPTFWDTWDCPEFVPSAGIFRYTYWRTNHVEMETRNSLGPVPVLVTFTRRSAGWILRGGRLFSVPEDELFAQNDELSAENKDARWPPGKEDPAYALANERFRQQRLAWAEAWSVRRRQLRASGVDLITLPRSGAPERQNRQMFIAKYHREGWGPSDLPDWFWDTEACPPFEPPNGVRLFEYGEQDKNPDTGELGTFIRCSASWDWTLFPCEVSMNEPMERCDWVAGVHPEGTRPFTYEDQNRRWDTAKHAWEEEWRARGRRRGKDPFGGPH
jgi:hypothetical protein